MPRTLRRIVVKAGTPLLFNGSFSVDAITVPPHPVRCGPETGDPLQLAVLGDSLALSAGVHHPDQALATLGARALADAAQRPVELRMLARIGTTSRWLERQVTTALRGTPGLASIVVGGNDVLSPTRTRTAARLLRVQVERLREAGWQVLVATCPHVGDQPALRAWVRETSRRRSRRLAGQQTVAALQAGARTVSLYDPEAHTTEEGITSPDRFHPSARGYALHLPRLLPAVLAFLDEAHGTPAPPADVSLDEAAALAVQHPGTHCVPLGSGRAAVHLPPGCAVRLPSSRSAEYAGDSP
ncbi:GDSL-type esterase/lipase family protein [Streptomyces sp. NPDC045431]|uniref:GDSL-type esterase/lipase family protein n=1 Tax=Streptomyces sp. NPDC045431 TaxID=3155613 RepID=UPI0033F8F364